MIEGFFICCCFICRSKRSRCLSLSATMRSVRIQSRAGKGKDEVGVLFLFESYMILRIIVSISISIV